MNHLTAAHRTMPLPSYARVTNKKNGRSVVVRVNDRGPFSNNRIIDLSKRAAYLLDFISAGTADVTVEYLGRAPLHGEDDTFLLASFRGAPTTGTPRGANPDLPGVRSPDVMVASNETQPAATPVNALIAPRANARPIIALQPGQISAYANWRVATAFDGTSARLVSAENWKTAR